MSKRKAAAMVSFVFILFIATVLFLKPFGQKPLAELNAGEVRFAYLTMTPPQQTIEVREEALLKRLVGILNSLVVYQEDEAGREYAGQLVEAKIVLQDGTTHTIGAYNPFLFFDGICYRTEYQPCEELSQFGNQLLQK